MRETVILFKKGRFPAFRGRAVSKYTIYKWRGFREADGGVLLGSTTSKACCSPGNEYQGCAAGNWLTFLRFNLRRQRHKSKPVIHLRHGF
jgi:hypothetical protein